MNSRSRRVTLGSLRVRVPHMSEADACRVASGVAARIAAQPAPARDIASLQVRVAAPAHATADTIAALVADAIGKAAR